jgi:hypothetical protein
MLLATGAAIFFGHSAEAAVPDRFGFALWSGGFVTQAQPAGTTVTNTGVGRWMVRFPGQAFGGGVVHVTAVHDALSFPPGRWCQVESWGPSGADEIVKVACYRPGGFLDNQPGFSVQWSASSGPVGGGFYGYMFNTAGCGIVFTYNSVGAANTCLHAGVGSYSIAFNALGTPGPNDGGLQVTAVNGAVGARCKVAGWSSSPNGQFVRIFCFNSAGALADNNFTATYQFKRSLYGPAFPPTRFGYLWNRPPLGPPTTNFNSTGPLNGLAGGPPVWTASFPNLFTTAPSNTQVTAFGTSNFFCALHKPWAASGTTVIAYVGCFDNAGNPVNSGFFVSHSSRI